MPFPRHLPSWQVHLHIPHIYSHFRLTHSKGRKSPAQIGLARLITDEVTFAYMTDVYILTEYQGKGLGTWLLECVNETIDSWPEFRRALLMSGNETGKVLYKKKLGMEPFPQGKNGLEVLSKTGRGSVLPN
jgi:ribosomal protein S18 acetylase RimI-like enzyme